MSRSPRLAPLVSAALGIVAAGSLAVAAIVGQGQTIAPGAKDPLQAKRPTATAGTPPLVLPAPASAAQPGPFPVIPGLPVATPDDVPAFEPAVVEPSTPIALSGGLSATLDADPGGDPPGEEDEVSASADEEPIADRHKNQKGKGHGKDTPGHTKSPSAKSPKHASKDKPPHAGKPTPPKNSKHESKGKPPHAGKPTPAKNSKHESKGKPPHAGKPTPAKNSKHESKGKPPHAGKGKPAHADKGKPAHAGRSKRGRGRKH